MGLLASEVLMENAGRAVVSIILESYPALKRCVILCGSGNNGGDGLVVARVLHTLNIPLLTFMLAKDQHALSTDCCHQLRMFENVDGTVVWLSESSWRQSVPTLLSTDILVDAIFGTGFTPRAIQGWRADLIQHLTPTPCPVVSIDVPSGLHPDRSALPDVFIHADHTVLFGHARRCHLFFPATSACGVTHVAEIGLPKETAAINMISPQNLPGLSLRQSDTHKYNYGHCLIMAGSPGMSGAAVLCAKGSLVAGGGLVTIMTDPACVDIIAGAVPQAMVYPRPSFDDIITYIEARKVSEIVVGPSLGRSDSSKIILSAVASIPLPLVLDADALSMLASDPALQDVVRSRTAPTILTPHYGEASRFLSLSLKEIHDDPINAAQLLTATFSAIVLIKGARSIISFPDLSIWISLSGNPGMATGGSGDVLAGILASVIHHRGVNDGVKLSCYAHGLSGDLAAVMVGQDALSPLDIIDHFPQALAEIKRRQFMYRPALIETL